MYPPPKIPWQITGNHWVSVPCIHPVDGAVHGLGLIVRRLRGTVEFSGGAAFWEGSGEPLLRLGIQVDGVAADLGAAGMAWQRLSEWLPTFNASVGDLTIRGTIFAPHGRGAEVPGVIYAVSFENRGTREVSVTFAPGGVLGHRQHRVCTARRLDDAHTVSVQGDVVTLSGASPQDNAALAIGLDGTDDRVGRANAEVRPDGAVVWSITQEIVVGAGSRVETAVYIAAAPEPDGAVATLGVMRRRGWRTAAETTRQALVAFEQSTSVASADRLVNRHLMFAYFGSVARAIDDAQFYVVRTRMPWHSRGVTARDWDALMWVLPAVQLADPEVARELVLRICELHGYAPGRGLSYLDGVPFRPGFSLDGAAAYPVAIDRYIAQTGDDRIVEEHIIADTLYAAYEDITARRHESIPLYATEEMASGAIDLPYALHANAVVSHVLDIFRQTLDEKTAATVETGDIVRAAISRHFTIDPKGDASALSSAIDLNGGISTADDPVSSVYWLPVYDIVSRTDSTYRRTVKRMEEQARDDASDETSVALLCAKLIGPDGRAVFDFLRRATMDNGVAAEVVDQQGNAVGNGGDASLSGLVAYTVWYAVHALGVRL